MNFVCESCRDDQHGACDNIYHYGVDGAGNVYVKKRSEQVDTHCDCQHRKRKP